MAQGNAGGMGGLGKFTELRQRLIFVIGALIVYRIGCFIPVPGVNPDAMLAMMQAQGPIALLGWAPALFVVIFGVLKSTDGPNRYGDEPTRF